MKKIIKPENINKLSDAYPSENRDTLQNRLKALQKMLSEGAEIADDYGHIAHSLQRVPSGGKEIFTLTEDLAGNIESFKRVFADCDDVIFREFIIRSRNIKAVVFYVHGMIDKENLQQQVIKNLMFEQHSGNRLEQDINGEELLTLLKDQVISAAEAKKMTNTQDIIQQVLSGETALLIEGAASVVLIDNRKWVKRPISEPNNESVLRGPREGFNETLFDSVVLIRRRAKDPHLKVHYLQVGERTNVKLAVLYISNIAKPELVQEVIQRIGSIKTDMVLSAGKIEQMMEESPYSFFPQVQTTERPDTVVASLYEGRVSIIIDGTPIALIAPVIFPQLLQSPEDYTQRTLNSNLITFVRVASVLFAVFLPGFYIALISFNPGMIPTSLVLEVVKMRAAVPFPAIVEASIMEMYLLLLQESAARLPSKITATVAVVGGIVIGDAVVRAGLVSSPMVVVTALTAIASFTLPNYTLNLALRLCRIGVTLLSAVFGIFGLTLGFLILLIHTCSLRSFGESFMGPLFDIRLMEDWGGMIARAPLRLLKDRPKVFGAQDRTR